MANEVAPKGKIWQCQACGKTSQDLFGYQNASYGWDESCILNAALVPDYEARGFNSRSEMRRIDLQKEIPNEQKTDGKRRSSKRSRKDG